MNVLLVYPRHPDTFWGYRHALKFVSKKAGEPPLGLLTIAAMLPREWTRRLVDMNVSALRDKDLHWADCVFISAMDIQRESVHQVLSRCRDMGKTIVAGGPLFTAHADEFSDLVDHLVLNEAEITLPCFLADLKAGHPQHLYTSSARADITTTPIPDWGLLDMRKYATMDIQYSRGCPFDCEFCDITVLYGHVPRTKSADQIIAELERLYQLGWHSGVFFVDDNFVGNHKKLRNEVLPAIIEWMDRRRQPFSFATEASIDLSDDPELMSLMSRAGFGRVFVGIESPNEDSLKECKKVQNRKRNLLESIHILQRHGIQVQAGFILGFDSDPPSIFDRMGKFIQESGVVSAMVGLLNAPVGTKLHSRLLSEGRILGDIQGNNTSTCINFVPRMDLSALQKGYQRLLKNIYAPRQYYARVRSFLKEYRLPARVPKSLSWADISALGKSMAVLGIVGRERFHYWRLFFWSLVTRPRLFPLAITCAIYGFHYRKIAERICAQ